MVALQPASANKWPGNLHIDGKALPLGKANKLPVHLRFDAKVIDVKPEDLQAADVIDIQERYLPVNDYYTDEYVVTLKKDKFWTLPEDASDDDKLKRDVHPDPVIYLKEAVAHSLGARLGMKEGAVQWYTTRRRIPFGRPQKFFVHADRELALYQERICEDYTDLPIPPTPFDEAAALKKLKDTHQTPQPIAAA